MVKKALCCGLNYPQQKYQLYGCINDCLDWEHLLRNTFQFDESRVLIDQNPDGSLATAPTQIPTRANILAQLGWLCSGAEPGDTLVFVFAGHGCQVRNAYGQIEQALVPEDFQTADETGDPVLVMEDELQALFMRLPPGSFLTVILDCCHATHMLDVPCSVDTSQPVRTLNSCERPREVPGRTEEAWHKALISHALARPRFVPTVTAPAPRQRRIADGYGAHAGKMTLDEGVTAFCFSACRASESGYDASIKAHQRGVMSFCLLEALQSLRHRCTYEQLLEKAASKLEDIREKYMPTMDQHIQLSFCPNSSPNEVVVFDERYATVAQHRLSQRAEQQWQEPASPSDGRQQEHHHHQNGSGGYGARDGGNDVVPTPGYTQHGAAPVGASPASHAPPAPAAALYLAVHAAHSLRNRDTGLIGDVSDPYVVARMGRQEQRTPVINNDLDPVWTEGNQFTFPLGERDTALELEVRNSNIFKDASLGRTVVDLRGLAPNQWHRRRERLRDGGGDGELEFDVHLAARQGYVVAGGGGSSQAPSPTAASGSQQGFGRRPPSPSPSSQGFGGPAGADGMHARPQVPQGMATPGGSAWTGPALFGTPNLLAAMPGIMQSLCNPGAAPTLAVPGPTATAAAAPTPASSMMVAPGSLGVTVPAAGRRMPPRTLSGQMPGTLAAAYAASATPTMQASRNAYAAATSRASPEMYVVGPDTNRDGIPDVLQQARGVVVAAPVYGQMHGGVYMGAVQHVTTAVPQTGAVTYSNPYPQSGWHY